MRVLIACEYSGTVRDAFLRRGHDAMSCDLLPTDVPGPHYQGDVFDIINDGWDLMIAHPPCTHLSVAGNGYWKEKKADGRQQAAIDFVKKLFESDIQKICVENPVGILSTVWMKPTQYIDPFYFGEPYRKKTGLWLKNLVPLKPTDMVKPTTYWVNGGSNYRKNKDDKRPKLEAGMHRDWKLRSKTFQGIADAMAEQWSA
jgi:site-specific DNA-cytosine methylase